MRDFASAPLVILFLLGSSIFWNSCKERTVTPGDLIPEVDNINTFGLDASFFDVSLTTGVFDSLKTSDYKNNIAAVGQVTNDPFFGSLSSGLFVQFIPPTTFFSFPKNTVLDSAFLILPYADFSYGDLASPSDNLLSLQVYRVSASFQKEKDYFSFDSLEHGGTPIGSGTHSLQALNDTVATTIDTLAKQLKIPLAQEFANSVFNANDSRFNSPGSFLEFMNGFYVKSVSATGNGRVSYFKLLGESVKTSARLSFYVRYDDDSSAVFHFPFNASSTAFFNKITRMYGGSPADNFVTTAKHDSVLVQGYPGFYTEITLKNLDKIPASIINKAEIQITSQPLGQSDLFAAPPRLIVEMKDEEGKLSPIADLFASNGDPNQGGADFVNGYGTSLTIGSAKHVRYSLNFPRALQQAIKEGKDELTLRISSANSFPAAFRLLGYGLAANPETAFKVNIIYTKN